MLEEEEEGWERERWVDVSGMLPGRLSFGGSDIWVGSMILISLTDGKVLDRGNIDACDLWRKSSLLSRTINRI